MEPILLGTTLTLFPTADHRELSLGAYGFQTAPSFLGAPTVGDFVPPQGLDLQMRRVFDTEDSGEDDVSGTGTQWRLRAYRAPDGTFHIDELSVENPLFLVRQRPLLGDTFDLGVITGRWDEIWAFGNTERVQWRVWSPIQVTLLGLSNNDMDDTDRLKYYIAGGFGFGAEGMVKLLGPVGVQARVDAGTTSTNRMREGKNATRHELELNAEASLGLMLGKQAWLLGAWGSQVTQWDPRDAEGRDGVDRQVLAGGVRLSARFYKDRELPLEGTMDFDALLRELQEQMEAEEGAPRGLFDKPGDPEGGPTENLDGGKLGGGAAGPSLLEVHWSEVEVLSGRAPELPAELPADTLCELRVDIDPTGHPYAIEPLSCPDSVRAPVMAAAWTWTFTPVQSAGDTVPARFVLPWTPALTPPAAP